jgi:hypothetical protein
VSAEVPVTVGVHGDALGVFDVFPGVGGSGVGEALNVGGGVGRSDAVAGNDVALEAVVGGEAGVVGVGVELEDTVVDQSGAGEGVAAIDQ